MRQIITLVGTSVLTNGRRVLKRERSTREELLEYLRSVDETAGSAETNSLQHLLVEDDGLIFLHSDTPEGFLCAEVLDGFYSHGRHGHQRVLVGAIEARVIAERRFAQLGLRSLVTVLAGLVQREARAGRAVVLNATGGFKAEAAYATLVGILFKLPVYYIHELFGEIIQLPAFPLDVDLGLIARDEPFLVWLDGEPRRTVEVRSRLHHTEPGVQMLLAEEGEYTFLSPLGEALFHAYWTQRHADEAVPFPPVSSRRSEEKLRFVQDEPNVPRGTMAVAERLARNRYVEEVRGGEFLDAAKARVQREYQEEGRHKIRVIYSDGAKGVYLTLSTTAQTAAQNTLVRRQVEEALKG